MTERELFIVLLEQEIRLDEIGASLSNLRDGIRSVETSLALLRKRIAEEGITNERDE